MSRLQKTKHPDGSDGWQWDDGPIFAEPDGRKLAVSYGLAAQRLEDLRELSALQASKRLLMQELAILTTSRRDTWA